MLSLTSVGGALFFQAKLIRPAAEQWRQHAGAPWSLAGVLYAVGVLLLVAGAPEFASLPEWAISKLSRSVLQHGAMLVARPIPSRKRKIPWQISSN